MIVTQEMRETMRDATRAGITKETIGSLNNSAARYRRRNDTKGEFECLSHALEIHNTWGAKLPEAYAMGAGTLERVTTRLKELAG